MGLPKYTGDEPCRTGNPDRFFPTDGPGALAAKTECKTCPLVNACLDYALHNAVVGVWGGTTTHERERMRRKAKIVAEPLLPPASESGAHRIDHAQVRRMMQRGTPVETVAELTNTTVEMIRRIMRRPIAA
jgi:WhiB family redox-sensing transcriptional regulator